jgi:hypothetical protein
VRRRPLDVQLRDLLYRFEVRTQTGGREDEGQKIALKAGKEAG